MTETPPLSAQDALVALMIAVSVADANIRTSELVQISNIVNNLPVFGDYDAGHIPRMSELVFALTVFVLSLLLGNEVITKVPPTLHTPLMSGSNAISGITLVGALVSVSTEHTLLANIFGFLAVTSATINVVGGFLVTDRMLGMFGKKKK